jgi:D-alanyl-D-alanine carboxypeptidase/D-alanyl-D-alanine-endopeptidase (penicillin-binding protein 4)
MKKSVAVLACLLLATPTFLSTPANALDPTRVSKVFTKYIENKGLANPSVVVIDEETGETVFEKNPNSLRKPASLQKLFTGVAAVNHLQMDQTFTTSLWSGSDSKTVVIQGNRDPWTSQYSSTAKKMGRTSLPRFQYHALKTLNEINEGAVNKATIYYSRLFAGDVATIKTLFRKNGVTAVMKPVSAQEAIERSSTLLIDSTSPTLDEMLTFALVWSDNVLSERIARLASSAAGNGLTESGVEATFNELLTSFELDTNKVVVKDASGLSRKNRVTAKQVGELLIKIRKDERYAPVVNGLPVGGISGTLQKRFVKTAPSAIGLVKAKTGTLNGTANLAGYVESGDHEYAFVIIADKLPRTYSAGDRARAIVDRILGKIAAPFIALFNLDDAEEDAAPEAEAETEAELVSSETP